MTEPEVIFIVGSQRRSAQLESMERSLACQRNKRKKSKQRSFRLYRSARVCVERLTWLSAHKLWETLSASEKRTLRECRLTSCCFLCCDDDPSQTAEAWNWLSSFTSNCTLLNRMCFDLMECRTKVLRLGTGSSLKQRAIEWVIELKHWPSLPFPVSDSINRRVRVTQSTKLLIKFFAALPFCHSHRLKACYADSSLCLLDVYQQRKSSRSE